MIEVIIVLVIVCAILGILITLGILLGSLIDKQLTDKANWYDDVHEMD